MTRQTKTKSDRAAQRCAACGAKMWLWDEMQHRWQGEYHFAECSTGISGAMVSVANADAREAWEQEKVVPREMGVRILQAIRSLIALPKGKDGKPTKAYWDRKAAILERLGKLKEA